MGDVVLGCCCCSHFCISILSLYKRLAKTYLGSFTSMHLEAVKLMFYSKQTKTEDPGWVLRAPVWTLTLDWACTLCMHVPDELHRREIVITKTAFLAHTLYTHTHTEHKQSVEQVGPTFLFTISNFWKKKIFTMDGGSTLVERAVHTHSTRLFSFTRYSSPVFVFWAWNSHENYIVKC